MIGGDGFKCNDFATLENFGLRGDQQNLFFSPCKVTDLATASTLATVPRNGTIWDFVAATAFVAAVSVFFSWAKAVVIDAPASAAINAIEMNSFFIVCVITILAKSAVSMVAEPVGI